MNDYGRVAAWTILLVALLVCGCATLQGPTPHQEVVATIVEYYEAEKAEDVDRIMAVFSDEFTNSMGASKAMLRPFFEALVASGILRSVELDLSDCEIAVEDDHASAAPVTFTTSQGTNAYSYQLIRETDGVWRIINGEQI